MGGGLHVRRKHPLHFAQVGHLGEGVGQLDHGAYVPATIGQIAFGKAANRVHAAVTTNRIRAGIQRFQSHSLERLEVLVASDAECDDDARCNLELLPRQVDRLCGLGAAQLIDGERMAINAAQGNSTLIRQGDTGVYLYIGT
jgi:hypothetical protein|eukprot:6587178-Prymnesium_polylepis.1